ncbi:hypothetical protein [Marinoscillum pacificum]|uniref:hypothetical protein n=1 Tax=Marinoscillum pacificum TaxID=392723 RepID=UPI002158929C|nr:hypothetical protein [Marinoscillum pacificum]
MIRLLKFKTIVLCIIIASINIGCKENKVVPDIPVGTMEMELLGINGSGNVDKFHGTDTEHTYFSIRSGGISDSIVISFRFYFEFATNTSQNLYLEIWAETIVGQDYLNDDGEFEPSTLKPIITGSELGNNISIISFYSEDCQLSSFENQHQIEIVDTSIIELDNNTHDAIITGKIEAEFGPKCSDQTVELKNGVFKSRVTLFY